MKRILAQCMKELAQFRRDKLTVALAFVLPFMSYLLFGYATRLEQKDIPIAVQDLDNSPLSRAYTERLYANAQFSKVSYGGGDIVKRALDSGLASAVVIIPPEFSRWYKEGRGGRVEVLVDGSDVNNARVIKNSVVGTTRSFLQTIGAYPKKQSIEPKIRLWFNPGRQEKLYVVPGVFAIVLWIFPSLLSALAMAREKEQGTMLQAYASSITPFELIAGKAIAYWVVGMFEALFIIGTALIVSGLRPAGDPTPFMVGTVLFIAIAVIYGLIIGSGVSSQSAAVQAVAFSGFTPALLLSGFLYPVRNIVYPLSLISYIVPARYYIVLSRDAFVRGGGWPGTWYIPILFVVFALVYLRVSTKRLGKMQLKG